MTLITTIKAEGLIGQLADELVISYTAEDKTITQIVTALLNLQVLTPEITVGTIDPVVTRSISVTEDTTLRALYRLRDTVGGHIYVDNSRALQWKTTIVDNIGQQIRYRKNLKGITREIDYTTLANKIYAYGAGEGDARIKLSDVESLLTSEASIEQKDVAVADASLFEEGIAVTISDDAASEENTIDTIAGNTLIMTTNLAHTYTTEANGKVNRGEDYIEDTGEDSSQDRWDGIYVKVAVDKSITHPDTLLEWAKLRLADLKEPRITYRVDTVDLSESIEVDFSFEVLQIGSTIKVIDEDLGIDVSAQVVKITHPDLLHPELMEIEVANRTKDITDTLAEVYDIQQLTSHIATEIGAGQVIVKGAFTVKDWVTEGETTIVGSNIQTGTVTLNRLDFIPLSAGGVDPGTNKIIATINATDEGGLKISADKVAVIAGVNIFKQPTIPVSEKVGDLWFDTSDKNKLYRAACVGADAITEGEWELVRDEDIAQALADAAAAQTAASDAQDDATEALGDLSDIADDEKVTPVEKLAAKKLWDEAVNEKSGIDTQADTFSVSKTDYDNAYNALNTYLNTTLNVFGNMDATTSITRSTWNTNWNTYYTEKIDLLNAIAKKAKDLANAAQADATQALADAATALRSQMVK